MAPLLVLQSTQRTPEHIVAAAKAYAHTHWRLQGELRKTFAGMDYLNEDTVHRSGPRQALLAPVLAASFYGAAPSSELCLALGLTTEASAALDYAVITVTNTGQIAVADNFKCTKKKSSCGTLSRGSGCRKTM